MYFKIKPECEVLIKCPYSMASIEVKDILWQGIHVCARGLSPVNHSSIFSTLPCGNTLQYPYQIDVDKRRVFGASEPQYWLGDPLLNSLLNPREEKIRFTVKKYKGVSKVVILNCIDFMYGHALLKLLNAEMLLRDLPSDYGLVVIVQPSLEWLVPKEVAEIWVADIAFSNARNFYKDFHEKVSLEMKRFSDINLACGFSHPRDVDIRNFSGIGFHDMKAKNYRITYVWREERVWPGKIPFMNEILRGKTKRWLLKKIQCRAIVRLFSYIKKHLPEARLTVIGLGNFGSFPSWIEDKRVARFCEETEKLQCKIASESRIVIGPHGSSLLLPSAHAGMTIHLVHPFGWNNIAQDHLYQPFLMEDVRLAAYRVRYLPLESSPVFIADMVVNMIKYEAGAYEAFCAEDIYGKKL